MVPARTQCARPCQAHPPFALLRLPALWRAQFLHYQDDWYVLAEKKDAYAVIYYRGSNDAWDGYGGATIYTREPTLPKKYYAEIDASLVRGALDPSAALAFSGSTQCRRSMKRCVRIAKSGE